jgi:acetyl-CoA carboxylase biotin carboxylase subunit
MQRRHQKIIEEAPAPGIAARHIARIGERCAEACRRINYRGAGTFEFLYENNEFYFIEMNTRIQVEHPVTELITGIDLVSRADPHRRRRETALPAARPHFPRTCHRMPHQRRRSLHLRPITRQDQLLSPARRPGIRVDSHIYQGYTVPSHYDSMVAKVIAYGDTRDQAIRRMRIALSEMSIEGIKTNIALHQELMHDARFMEGAVPASTISSTGWPPRTK